MSSVANRHHYCKRVAMRLVAEVELDDRVNVERGFHSLYGKVELKRCKV